MSTLKRLTIAVPVLLLMSVCYVQSGCTWESNKNCSLVCKSTSLFPLDKCEDIMTKLNGIEWNKRPDCQRDGIDLKLENLKYSGDTLGPGFFTASVIVKELTITLRYLPLLDAGDKIEIDAFREGLKFVKKLVLKNVFFSPIKNGTFNGLENLEVLKIEGTQLNVIQSGVLDVLNETLKEFSLEDAIISEAIWIDGLTGTGAMAKLEKVKFAYNLNKSIGKKTFVGLSSLKTLDLSSCQIEAILPGVFDSMDALEVLKLEKNRLTTIPDGFFNVILLRGKTQIFLAGNPFSCDCNLMPFKTSLIEHSNNFEGELTCKNAPFKDHGILAIKFDTESCVVPTTTPSSTSVMPPTLLCMPSDGSGISEVVTIASPVHRLQLHETANDEVIIQVDGLMENSILIWFSLNEPSPEAYSNANDNANCLIGSGSTFRIDNLMENSVYTFCLVGSMNVTSISPLDCISYAKMSDSDLIPWLHINQRSRTIGITFVACGLTTLFGLAAGVLTSKAKIWIRNRAERFVRSCRSHRAGGMRMSETTSNGHSTRRTSSTTVQYYLNGNYDAPPLPARPASMYRMDEPVYDTIRDLESISGRVQTTGNL